jgi:hypothetical protein
MIVETIKMVEHKMRRTVDQEKELETTNTYRKIEE